MKRVGRFGACTAKGASHSVNQDRWLAEPGYGLFAVADGISSKLVGEEAARLAVKSLPVLLSRALGEIPNAVSVAAEPAVADALKTLNTKLHALGERDSARRGLGTTLVVLLVGDSVALVGHAGDSRCYLLRNATLTQLTHDHTLARVLVDVGELEAEQAEKHPTRSQLSKYVGMEGDLGADVSSFVVQPGDRFLLCTDGLSGVLSEAELALILNASDDAERTAATLVDEAENRPGHDDITALVIDI